MTTALLIVFLSATGADFFPVSRLAPQQHELCAQSARVLNEYHIRDNGEMFACVLVPSPTDNARQRLDSFTDTPKTLSSVLKSATNARVKGLLR